MPEITVIYPSDAKGREAVCTLLHRCGLRLDAHLDYTCAIYDAEQKVIATGSCYANTLRCLAVDPLHRGEALLNDIVAHLMEVQAQRGHASVFLYTKPEAARLLATLGFHEIVRAEAGVVFMENRPWGFADYLENLKRESPQTPNTTIAAIVMNANPFTRGHLHLVETAARENAWVHLFIVSEEASLFPFAVRERLVREGTAHLPNLIYHASGDYIISRATFPAYFQKDEDSIARGYAQIDLAIFARLARALGITRRYVGEEKASHVTNLYNEEMQKLLPQCGIACKILPRAEYQQQPISASTVRTLLQQGNISAIAPLVPPTTLAYLQSDESHLLRQKIQEAVHVAHDW